MRLCYVGIYTIHTLRWVRYFAARGHDVHLITIQPARPPLPENVTIYDLTQGTTRSKLRYPIWVRRARSIVRAIQPDILHAHQASAPGWIATATGFHPLVVTAWGSDLLVTAHRSWPLYLLARWVLQSADYVTCVSHSLADAAVALGVDPSIVEVAPWGVDTDLYHPAADVAQVRARLGLGPGPVILSPRQLKPLYNPLDIAAAIPLVLRSLPSAQFIMRTYNFDPQTLNRFKMEVHKYGVEPAVRYVGNLDSEQAIADLYRASDVIVSVPSSDGAPASVLEALACGALPVLSDLPSLREWIEHYRHGILVPVGDVEAIARGIIRLVRDAPLRSRMRTEIAHLIASRADRQVLMAKNEQVYDRLIARGH